MGNIFTGGLPNGRMPAYLVETEEDRKVLEARTGEAVPEAGKIYVAMHGKFFMHEASEKEALENAGYVVAKAA